MLDVLEPWLRSADLVEQVRDIVRLAATRAGDLDQDGAFPTEDIRALAAVGARGPRTRHRANLEPAREGSPPGTAATKGPPTRRASLASIMRVG